MKKAFALFCVTCVFTLQPLSALALTVAPEFNPNIIIPDTAFNDTQTFGGPDGIQHFLESKNSPLANTSTDFLTMLHEPDSVTLKQALNDPEPNLGRLRTAAELIWDAAQVSGLNPQVVLVTLEKEQGLVTGAVSPSRLQRALNHAMGFDCPDGSGCGNLFPGFYYQLFGNTDTEGNRYLGATKSLMKSFSTPEGRGPSVNGATTRVGDNVSLDNTLGDYLGILKQQLVTLGNRATAALYRYTPHVFDGNYNFWQFFTSWFKYPNGTLLTTLSDKTIYIIENGTRQQLPTFVASARGISLTSIITASPTELASYPIGPTYAPTNNTVAITNGSFYVFIDGVAHPASTFVLKQRKLDPTKSLNVSSDELALFVSGSQLTPTDGTVLRGAGGQSTYLVDAGALKRFSAFTLKQRNAAKQTIIIPDTELASYPKQGYVIPLDGTLVRAPSQTDTYLVRQQQRLPLTSALFKNLGFSTKQVVTLSADAELASIPLGPPSTPREGTFFSISGSPELYLFKVGAKHLIPSFVAKQRGITPDYAFDASIVSNWPDGIAVPPKDGTVLKSDQSASVYVVQNGQLHPVTTELFTNLGLNLKQVRTLPDAEVSVLAKGGYATPVENTYVQDKETKALYVYKAGNLHEIFPFVATQRGMTPDITLHDEVVNDWTVGTPILPRDGTLLKSSTSATIYLFSQGTLHTISPSAIKRRGYNIKLVKTIPKDQLNALPTGAAMKS